MKADLTMLEERSENTTRIVPETRVPSPRPIPPYTLAISEASNAPYRGNWYETPIVDGIYIGARRLKHNVILLSGYPGRDLLRNLSTCAGLATGLIQVHSRIEEGMYEATSDCVWPTVTVGGRVPDGCLTSIDIDNVAAARQATRHLIELGHRRIAYLSANDPRDLLPVKTATLRETGYRLAHEDAGLALDESLIIEGWSTMQSGSERGGKIALMPPEIRPTAIFCFNDGVALGLMRVLTGFLRVPEDISVVGFDDIVEATMARPALTTVRQSLRQIGERSVELMVDTIEGRIPRGHEEIVPYEFIVRQSTCRPPG